MATHSLRLNATGWIGLGAMGHPMALNLFTKTYIAHQQGASSGNSIRFFICEQDDSKADAFVRELKARGGMDLADRVMRVGSGREMALAASRIFTMLPSTPQVETVYLDPSHGILAGLRQLPKDTLALTPRSSRTVDSLNEAEGVEKECIVPTSPDSSPSTASSSTVVPHTLLVDQTTLDPTVSLQVSSVIHQETSRKALMLDAPVSGGTVAAQKGDLTIMFGSPSDTATLLATPLLQRMARVNGVIECGKSAAGVGVKVCNNLVLACNQIALAEGLALGQSLGIDPSLLTGVINSSSGSSWSSRTNPPVKEIPNTPASRDYSGGFQTRLMLKDVSLALSAAHKHDLPTPLTWASQSIYESVCQEGDGSWAGKDFSVVYEWIQKKQREGVETGWKGDTGANL
ncbi:uncharacterized protein L203_100608 [Cryptococcus depauperatus CBS 7841]|uniref:3-hydroxyisobutyrate dehydrogenase n=1 Tax=Cryptococcus depauperatus CBS 7841 TaxID=1295531 RepID=A0A1E3IXH2_9TREE|nr:3-hydroxyisobutyrate dehydrogenase [Cryptococcus depauperatus CBS 7841]